MESPEASRTQRSSSQDQRRTQNPNTTQANNHVQESVIAEGIVLSMLCCRFFRMTHTIRDEVIVDQRLAAKEDFAHGQFTRVLDEIDQLVGKDDRAIMKKLDDPITRAKHSDLVD